MRACVHVCMCVRVSMCVVVLILLGVSSFSLKVLRQDQFLIPEITLKHSHCSACTIFLASNALNFSIYKNLTLALRPGLKVTFVVKPP